MNVKIPLIFAIALFAVGATHAFAQSGPMPDVVINEVDTNPSGLDSTSPREWVELYNPTNSTVHLGGWQIASTTLTRALIISDGTYLNPGEFKTFLYAPSWFSDLNEQVQLRSRTGTIVDHTPKITDTDNNSFSWQRIYDGYDSDTASDWEFRAPTISGSNGKLPVITQETPVTVSASVENDSYIFGDVAVISGQVSEKILLEQPTFSPAKVEILVEGPNYYKEFSLFPDLRLNYNLELPLKKVVGINEGAYDVTVRYSGAVAQAAFSVAEQVIIQEEIQASEFSVYFDQESYLPGQTVTMTANTTEIIQFEGLTFTITGENEAEIAQGKLYPDGEGIFSTTVYMTTVEPVYGTYTALVEYAGKSATSTFVLLEEFVEAVPISLSTDKEVYGLGEIVEITGRLNNLWVFSLDYEIQQVGSTALSTEAAHLVKDLGAVRLDGDSRFSHDFKIGNNPDRYGDYRIRVSQDVGNAEVFFKVVENPATYVTGGDSPLTVSTDKETYEHGSKLLISGKISDIQTSSSFYTSTVELTIKKSDGTPLTSVTREKSTNDKGSADYTLTAVPDIGGNYAAEDTLYTTIYAPGSYIIDASYANNKYRASTTFSVVDPLDIAETFQLELNKEIFGLDEEVVVDGIIPGISQGTGIVITLYKPDGDKDEFGTLPENSQFSWSWKTPIEERSRTVSNDRNALSTNYGVYQVVFSTGSESRTLFFKVSPNPESDTLNVKPLEVTTDRLVYKAGETVSVSGVAQKRDSLKDGSAAQERVQITASNSATPLDVLYDVYLFLDIGGNFATTFDVPASRFGDGTYKITALYSGTRTTTVFTIDNDFDFDDSEELSLILRADKSEYAPGDSVSISGRLNKLVYLESIDLTIISEDAERATCGPTICGTTVISTILYPSATGSFDYTYDIPSTADSNGRYEAIADTSFGAFDLTFNVTDTPTLLEDTGDESAGGSQTAALRVTEKFNRISDSEIMISAGTTMQDEVELYPRTIQGSMFTPARGEESSVNLLIRAGDTCVIGPYDECLVAESTRAPGAIYKIVEIDGQNYKVRYSGPDAKLEKFTVLPESDGSIHVADWNVQIIKNEQPSRFYYKIIRTAQE